MKFWIITNCRNMSQPDLGDICFLTDVRSLMLQTLGGLRPEDVIGVYPEGEANEAKTHGTKVLQLHKKLRQLDKLSR